jgi:hypothetical protein
MAISSFFNVSVCAELVTLATALVTISNRRFGYYKAFTPYLIIILLTEFAGYYYKEVLHKPNYPFYNGLMLVQVLFFSFLFYQFLQSARSRVFILTCIILFLFFYLYETIRNDLSAYNKISRVSLSAIMVFLSCLFYFAIIRQEGVNNPLQYPPFWIVTGLFIYYFGSVTMFAFYDRVSQIKLAGTLSFYNVVMGCLSSILYGSWINSFICRRKQHL